jgi:serine/threonine protein kinase
MLLEGEQIGHYHLLRLLGTGSISEVYHATDSKLNREVAVKIIRTDITPYHAKSEAVRLFKRDMKAIGKLRHQHILPLFDYGKSNVQEIPFSYMVMPFCEDGSLATWLERRGTTDLLSLQEIASIITQAARALQYAHTHQIIHQDVRPANFLLQHDEDDPSHLHLLLADFGFARFTTATTSQVIRGTQTYMAPEQWRGHPVPATDQYALAVMAYELLTGCPPFHGSLSQIMYQHLNMPPQPPSTINPGLSSELDVVLLRALAKKPDERFPTISAFADAFQRALQAAEIDPPSNTENTDQPVLISNPIPLQPNAFASLSPPSQGPPTRASASRGKTSFGLLPSWGKAILLIGVVLLLIVSGSGLFYAIRTNQIATANLHATATTVAHNATGTTQANASVTADVNLYPPGGGILALYDPLREGSSGYRWDERSNNVGGTCEFTGGVYQVSESDTRYLISCFNETANFSNFVYEVQMKIIKGGLGGIMFRADSAQGKFYLFGIDQTGGYSFLLYTAGNGLNNTHYTFLKKASSSAIEEGLNQINLIAVVAKGSTITLYVNHQRIDTVNDSTYSHGQIGLFGYPYNIPIEVAFNNARIWTL